MLTTLVGLLALAWAVASVCLIAYVICDACIRLPIHTPRRPVPYTGPIFNRHGRECRT